jgi:hypothetical protein
VAVLRGLDVGFSRRDSPPVAGTIHRCEILVLASKSTSSASNSTHFPSGDGTGAPTRFSFIMSSNVKGCFCGGDCPNSDVVSARMTAIEAFMNRKALAELQNMQNSCLGGGRVSRVMPVRLGPIAPRNRRLSGKDAFWRSIATNKTLRTSVPSANLPRVQIDPAPVFPTGRNLSPAILENLARAPRANAREDFFL